MTGKELCSLSKDEFLARAPAYVGDIVWAHLEILQKETNGGSPKSNANSSNSSPTSTTNSNFPAAPSSQQPTYTTLEPSCSTPTSSSTTTAVPTTAAMRYTTAPPPLQRGVPAAAALPQGLPYPGGEYNSTGEIRVQYSIYQ